MSLGSSLAIAARSLEVSSAGIQVAGNNVSNANTPGYVRESLDLSSAFPSQRGRLIFGNGVMANGIKHNLDKFLETRIHTANSDFQGATTRNDIYKQLEVTLQELGDSDLSSGLNDLLARVNDLVNQPESAATRLMAVQEGVHFADSVTALRSRIDQLRLGVGTKVDDLVTEANQLIDQIHTLNPQIISLESAGLSHSDAGALRTQRLVALNRLSEILPIHTVEQASGGVDVFLGSEYLVLSKNVQHLQTVQTIDRGTSINNVVVENSLTPLSGSQGELNGTLYGRDTILGGFADQLDQFVSNVIFEFNKIHSSGQGTKGYTSLTGSYQVNDITAGLDAAGLDFLPQHGSFQVKVTNTATGLTQTTTIQVDLDNIGPNTSLDDLRTQLAAVSNLTASTTTDRRLSLSTAAGYEVQFANDTSGALAALGVNTFFTGSTSQDMGVNQLVRQDARLFAAGQGGGPSDGRNAAALARVIDNPVSSLGGMTLDQFYDSTMSTLAQSSASEAAVTQGFEGFRDSLVSQRQQYSGVSIDEEAIQIMKFQRSYQMAAKLVSTIDQLFSVLLNM